MTSLLDEARAHLVADGVGAVGASTSATSIFVDSLPEWEGVSIVLAQREGLEGVWHFGNDVPDIEQPRIEMLVRSTAPTGQVPASSASKTAAHRAYRSLVSIVNEPIAASTSVAARQWLSCDAPNGPPALFDRDSQGRIYWRCVFVRWRMSS